MHLRLAFLAHSSQPVVLDVIHVFQQEDAHDGLPEEAMNQAGISRTEQTNST